MNRVAMLESFLVKQPQDPFPRYALAMEHKNGGALALAAEHFKLLMDQHPDYTAAYLHAGNTALAQGQAGEARSIYEQGLVACQRKGDQHAASELQGALGTLP